MGAADLDSVAAAGDAMTLLARMWTLFCEWREWRQRARAQGPDDTVARMRRLLMRTE